MSRTREPDSETIAREGSGSETPGVSEGPLEVSLLCVHPLLVTEFRRVLSGGGFRVSYHRLEPGRVPDPEKWDVRPAPVHVLEADANASVTVAVIRRLLPVSPAGRILVVREEFPDREAFPLLSAGARGVLRYAEMESQLARALQVLAAGGFWVPRSLLSAFVESVLASSRPIRSAPLAQGLSRREAEVLELLLRNLSNKEIAKELKISSRTAKFHVSNLLAKHGVGRRADLIVLAHAGTS